MPAGSAPPQNASPSTVSNNTTSGSSAQNNNFYENTMHSDTSSLQKRKSVISSQSTGSSNEVGYRARANVAISCHQVMSLIESRNCL